mmetsp:Transcript_19550/g.30054  ORF Transcript_19550/g.30054 Transcript_19550/m.30054 type:complete len:420 (-) Transcript_19550:2895-4154(-)
MLLQLTALVLGVLNEALPLLRLDNGELATARVQADETAVGVDGLRLRVIQATFHLTISEAPGAVLADGVDVFGNDVQVEFANEDELVVSEYGILYLLKEYLEVEVDVVVGQVATEGVPLLLKEVVRSEFALEILAGLVADVPLDLGAGRRACLLLLQLLVGRGWGRYWRSVVRQARVTHLENLLGVDVIAVLADLEGVRQQLSLVLHRVVSRVQLSRPGYCRKSVPWLLPIQNLARDLLNSHLFKAQLQKAKEQFLNELYYDGLCKDGLVVVVAVLGVLLRVCSLKTTFCLLSSFLAALFLSWSGPNTCLLLLPGLALLFLELGLHLLEVLGLILDELDYELLLGLDQPYNRVWIILQSLGDVFKQAVLDLFERDFNFLFRLGSWRFGVSRRFEGRRLQGWRLEFRGFGLVGGWLRVLR